MEYLKLFYEHWIITSIFLILFPFRLGSVFKFKFGDLKLKKDKE
jgi:hypothetical protein